MRRLLEITAGIGLAWIAGQAGAALLPPAAPAPPAIDDHGAPPLAAADRAIGPAFDDDASMAKHAEAIAGYTLRATLDPAAHTVHGEGQILWRNASRVAQRELWIHLYPNAFKNERTLFNRLSLGAFRGSGDLSDWGYIEVKRFAVREMEGADLWSSRDKTSPGDPEDETDIRV
ncbi:MAG: M1 family peptidase, partial [Minicystis sp.]